MVLLRGLEVLHTEGFTSPSYQRLLRSRYYREAIAVTCSDGERRAFESATEGLSVESLRKLYYAGTYLKGEGTEELAATNMVAECEGFLRHYHSWWLQGAEPKMAGFEGIGAAEAPAKDLDRFYLLCRAVYFSLLVVGSNPAGKDLLLSIAKTCPIGIADTDGEDLWLQRVAALKLFELEEPCTFHQHLTSIRPTIFYFLDALGKLSLEQKALMFEEARRYPPVETADGSTVITTWLTAELSDPEEWRQDILMELRERWA